MSQGKVNEIIIEEKKENKINFDSFKNSRVINIQENKFIEPNHKI